MQCYTFVVTRTWMPLKLAPRLSSGWAHPSFSVLVLLGMRRCKHDETSRGSSLTTTPILILNYIIEASALYYSIKRTLPNNIVWEVHKSSPYTCTSWHKSVLVKFVWCVPIHGEDYLCTSQKQLNRVNFPLFNGIIPYIKFQGIYVTEKRCNWEWISSN